MTWIWITIAFLLLMSAFFSGMEIAYVTSNKLKLELDKKQDNLTGKLLRKITESPGDFITTMLVGNNIALVLYGIYTAKIITDYIERFYPHMSPWMSLLVQSVLSGIVILILAEFIPKIIFQLYPNRSLRLFALPVYVVYMIFRPISWVVIKISNFLIRLFSKDKTNLSQISLTKTEMYKYLSQHVQTGDEEEDASEIKIFSNALKFGEVKAREIMVPRTDIVAVDIHESPEKLREAFLRSGHSKIIAYEDHIDNVLGYVHFFDLFKKPAHIRQILRKAIMVPETMPVEELLKKMTASKKSMAVVFGEYGGTAGIITLEDIMEKIFGDIEDEHDRDEPLNKRIDKDTYLFSAKMDITDINEKYNLRLPEKEDYESLGGYILELAGKIPEEGETVQDDQYVYKIVKANDKQIEEVEVRRLEDAD
ncbi:MAG: HlyC/CorC family transporter [Chlorobi bacterium]|nr:HlyC/CorC family transporter [Chlorobiota bacterium]